MLQRGELASSLGFHFFVCAQKEYAANCVHRRRGSNKRCQKCVRSSSQHTKMEKPEERGGSRMRVEERARWAENYAPRREAHERDRRRRRRAGHDLVRGHDERGTRSTGEGRALVRACQPGLVRLLSSAKEQAALSRDSVQARRSRSHLLDCATISIVTPPSSTLSHAIPALSF